MIHQVTLAVLDSLRVTEAKTSCPNEAGSHRYREVLELGRVQFVSAPVCVDFFEEIAIALPLTLPHEGVWHVARYSAHFTVTSEEAITVGPFKWLDTLQSELDTFGLELRSEEGALKGYAHFDNLEPGCIIDAIERLYWLEIQCWRINKATGDYTGQLWKEAVASSRKNVLRDVPEEDVINPLALFPDTLPRKSATNYA